MPDKKNFRKKANIYFFSKVLFNTLLIILGAVFIGIFLRRMQNQASLLKQRTSSVQALTETIECLETNERDAEELTRIFHEENQSMLDDMYELLYSGLFEYFRETDNETRTEILNQMLQRSGVDYLFLMDEEGKVLLSPYTDLYMKNLYQLGLLNKENEEKLLEGTRNADGTVSAVLEKNDYGYYYFYSIPGDQGGAKITVVLGADASMLDVQIDSLKDISAILSQASVGNNGFMFAVDTVDDTFLYYQNGEEVLTGKNALETGLSQEALEDGYSGTQTINGVKYYCVSKNFGSSTVICAVAQTEEILENDKYVLFWSDTSFIVVMIICLAYAVIVRNDFVRNAVQTKRKILMKTKKGNILFFDQSVFNKVFPLMIAGVMMIFGITFYTQTLLEISQSIEDSKVALDEVTGRYNESLRNRELIQNYYNERFLSKARIIAFLLEEDPSVLNEPSKKYHSEYDAQGVKHYLTDDEGNRLKSVASSARLQKLCESNDIDSIYVFDEDGYTIATNTPYWYFSISRNEEDQSNVFLQVLDSKVDYYIQEPMTDDLGNSNQYIGVDFYYFTTTDENGNTVYLSRHGGKASATALGEGTSAEQAEAGETETAPALETAEAAEAATAPEVTEAVPVSEMEEAATAQEATEAAAAQEAEDASEPERPVTEHTSMVQIGLNAELSDKLMASTDAAAILSSDLLSGGFIVLFDNSENNVCIYSPNEANVGRSAADLGISEKAFSGNDYYGFNRIDGINYFHFFHYQDEYFIGTAIPASSMYRARLIISLITAITSLFVILFLSGTVTMTTKEEEFLYATMSEVRASKGLDSAIFNVILPSGVKTSTVKAAARWDNRRIPWSEKAPEQKLLFMTSIMAGLFVLYVIVAVSGVTRFFGEGSVIQYIISGNWDRGINIFAFSCSILVLIATAILVSLFRIPVQIASALLGARGETISHLLLSVLKYGGTLGAFFYCLYLFGMDSTNLLASAGVLSLVIGLGAQSLIKDIIAGIFIVFEGEFRVGDIVTIGGFRGTVMDIGLRTTKILNTEGNIKIYNNSEISGVLNMTKEASIAMCSISIEYGQDIDYVEAVLNRDLPKLKQQNKKILEGPRYLGITELGDSGVGIKIICKCEEKEVKGINRYLNKEVLKIFYENGINVPFPNVTFSQLDMDGRKTMEDFREEEKEEEKEKQ